MAIGSSPEIGVSFRRFGDFEQDQHHLWYDHIRSFGEDLLKGYAVLAYPTSHRACPPLAIGLDHA